MFDKQRTLQYEGRIDDNPRESLVKTRDARNAIDALLGGQRVAVARTTAVGCPWPSKAPGRAEEMAKIQAEPVALEMADADSMKKLRAEPDRQAADGEFLGDLVRAVRHRIPGARDHLSDVPRARF